MIAREREKEEAGFNHKHETNIILEENYRKEKNFRAWKVILTIFFPPILLLNTFNQK